jgi:hypothetical protein
MKIVVVGNGPMPDLGKMIDKYDVVIRCNFYQISGFEKMVGTKTDIWAVGGLRDPKHSDCKIIWNCYSSPFIKQETMVLKNRLKDKSRLKPRNNKVNLELNEKLGYKESGFPHPSTGLLTIAHALAEYGPPIHICGFKIDEEHAAKHYYGHDEKHFRVIEARKDHNFQKEEEFINGLVNKGDLIRIG